MRQQCKRDARRWALALVGPVALSGCGSEQALQRTADAAEPTTFFQHVGPVFATKCMGCHQEGGIGPFRLDDYDQAVAWANRIADVTAARIMPPYLMETGGDCGQFDESAALTSEEIDSIAAWVEGGAVEGQPTELSRPELPVLEGAAAWSTPEFTPEIAGGALAAFDEYRCFRIPLETRAEQWATGWEVSPGNAALVHHVIGYIVQPEVPGADGTGRPNAEVMAELDAQSPDRDGWPCFGGAGAGVRVDSVPVGWAPGTGAVNFPEGVGIRVPIGSELVAQVHYNLAEQGSLGESDQTEIRMRFADQVTRQAVFLLEDDLLASLAAETPVVLPAGEAMYPFTWEARLGDRARLPEGSELMMLGPHMHERGRRWTFEIAQPGEDFECAGRVNRWDFNWQASYDYRSPPTMDPDTRLRLTCEYDTSADTEPVLPGWGTRNEMCLVSMMVALPPGVRF